MCLHCFTSPLLSSGVTSCQRYGDTTLASDCLQGKRVGLRATELACGTVHLSFGLCILQVLQPFLVGKWQTSQADVKMWTQGRVVKCAAPIPCCGPNCPEELHTLSSLVCNSSLDPAYFPPEGREDEPLNLHSSWRQKFSEKLGPWHGDFICMWMSCQPMVIAQWQHFPEWVGKAYMYRVYEVLLVSDEMKCP